MASNATSASHSTEASQYHHYIPQFILRTFSHQFRPPKGSKKRRGNGLYTGQPALYTINLDGPAPWIRETAVSRTFAITDMYRDFTAATNQQDLEKRLSRLESDVSKTVAAIRKAYDEGKQEIWLTRTHKDLLRKFLFIMKYRSSGFHRRFLKPSIDEYDLDDADRLRDYMRKKGYERPLDVWFDNMKALLDVQIDAGNQWMKFLQERMYEDDAMWAISNIQMFYMSICTPADEQNEFLLTQNAYSIFEGPVSRVRDTQSGGWVEPYTEFHMFFVISPKIVLVLRSFLLPNASEDHDESRKAWRKTMYALCTRQHSCPPLVKSVLEDLPVEMPRNSYTRMVNGRRILAAGEDGTFKPSHKFYFRFFRISTSHTNNINFIMLEECHGISVIAFRTKASAAKTLESYFTFPVTNLNARAPMKQVDGSPDDPRRICIDKLEQAARELGVNVKPVVAEGSANEVMLQIKEFNKLQMKWLETLMKDSLPKESTKTMALYGNLGGSADILFEDMDQARKWLKLRIKIDVWSQGIEESVRIQNRENLCDLFCQLLPRRMWYYVKYVRNMELAHPKEGLIQNPDSVSKKALVGPEDVIATFSYLFNFTDLARIMYYAAHHETYFAKAGCKDQASRVKNLAFSSVGSICNCGIPALEARAMFCIEASFKAGVPDDFNPEMSIRMLLRRNLVKFLGEELRDGNVEDLDRVLFDIIYPTASL